VPTTPDVPVLNAFNFYGQYSQNVVAADLAYTGKVVQLRDLGGKLYDDITISKDPAGHYYIGLQVDDYPHPIPSLICYVRDDALPRLAKASGRGLKFTVRGRVVGRRDQRGTWEGFAVVLKECEILSIANIKFGKETITPLP
jgi:hypothetical protein